MGVEAPRGPGDLAPVVDACVRRAWGRFVGSLDLAAPEAGLVDLAWSAIEGGKRLRGACVLIGADCAGAGTRFPPALGLAAALELYQASALVHDDVIDHADTRRGRPTPGAEAAREHRRRAWRGDPEDFGRSTAILVGDLLIAAADGEAALATGGLPPERREAVAARFARMEGEVALGQHLDLRAEQVPLDPARTDAVDQRAALRVARLKSARYSVVHPAALGALAAGGDAGLVDGLESALDPWGIAFQLRDDDLGVFGDPGVTGKPSGGDLREGKRTVLLALAWRAAPLAERATLARGLGDARASDQAIDELRDIVRRRGRAAHERLIARLSQQGADALRAAPVHEDGARLLGWLRERLVLRRA